MNYPKEYTVKEWKKFNKVLDMVPDDPRTNRPYQFFNFITKRLESYDYMTVQEVMINKFDIILLDYQIKNGLFSKDHYFDLDGIEKSDSIVNKKEKLFAVLDKFNAKNINKGIDKFNKGVDQFSKVVASSQGNNTKSKSKKMNLGISQKDYDKLFKSPKRKGNTMNFWNEDRKTRKRRNKRKPVQKAPDYSALIGKRKVKFF
uniref:ORF27 n=1 Tax=Nitrosopumilaceae spindle-shaped virus TaxID=3065433 RepID=A0AAT9JA39_9VIRU